MRSHSVGFTASFKLSLIFALLLMVGISGCGGASPDEDAEWVAENAGADTAVIETEDTVAEVVPSEPTDTTVTEAEPTFEPSHNQAEAVAEPTTDAFVAPEATDNTVMTGAGEIGRYTVRKNDTLMKVAFEIYGDISRWKDIYEMNRSEIKNANMIYAGMQLKYEKPMHVPDIARSGESYLIKDGDTLGSIADDIYAQRSKWKKLYENNRTLIRDPNRIYAGFYIYYQMTEEERQRAEELRAKRTNRLGVRPALPPVSVSSSGGLSDLAAPVSEDIEQDRSPTATQ